MTFEESDATTTTMDDIIEIGSDDSLDSIVEVEIPKKPSPPLVTIEDEEIILNIAQNKEDSILAGEFIRENNLPEAMTVTEKRTESSANINSPEHWTLDMIKFYNDDWGGEDQFIVEKLQEKMDKSPLLWDVTRRDILHVNKKLRKSNIRCWNCHQRGHHCSACPDPPHVPRCHMCGIEGHLDYNCPNSKCLNCGNPANEYVSFCYKCKTQLHQVCSRCQLMGHNFLNCSDHWRLFHLTTTSTSVIVPEKNIYKSDKDMWCCNCGRKGHYQTQCQQRKEFAGFRDTVPFVVSYQKAFNGTHNSEKLQFQPLLTSPVHRDGFQWKKKKGKRKGEFKGEKILKINPMNIAIGKDKNFKNRLKRNRKNRKKRRRNLQIISL